MGIRTHNASTPAVLLTGWLFDRTCRARDQDGNSELDRMLMALIGDSADPEAAKSLVLSVIRALGSSRKRRRLDGATDNHVLVLSEKLQPFRDALREILGQLKFRDSGSSCILS